MKSQLMEPHQWTEFDQTALADQMVLGAKGDGRPTHNCTEQQPP